MKAGKGRRGMVGMGRLGNGEGHEDESLAFTQCHFLRYIVLVIYSIF